MIIGWDISTKCVGYCILNNDGSLYEIDYIWLEKIENKYEKLNAIKDVLQNSLKISEDVFLFVEAPLPRSNNQNVTNILQRFNGQVCLLLYQHFGVEPVLISEKEVRTINGIKVPKGVKGGAKKEFVLKCLQDLCIIDPERWDLKRTGRYKDYCFDMSDAFWVARAGFKNAQSVLRD